MSPQVLTSRVSASLSSAIRAPHRLSSLSCWASAKALSRAGGGSKPTQARMKTRSKATVAEGTSGSRSPPTPDVCADMRWGELRQHPKVGDIVVHGSREARVAPPQMTRDRDKPVQRRQVEVIGAEHHRPDHLVAELSRLASLG